MVYRSLYYQVLGAEDYNEAEADEAAVEEFANDAAAEGDAKEMSRDEFCGGMFELADLHVSSLDADDYAKFLLDLLRDITARAGDGGLFCPSAADIEADRDARAREAAAAAAAAAAAKAAAKAAKGAKGGKGGKGGKRGKGGGSGADGLGGSGSCAGGLLGGLGDGSGANGGLSPRSLARLAAGEGLDGEGGGGGEDEASRLRSEAERQAKLDALFAKHPRDYCLGCKAELLCCECQTSPRLPSPPPRTTDSAELYSMMPPRTSSPPYRHSPPRTAEGRATTPYSALLAARRSNPSERPGSGVPPLWQQRQAAGLPVMQPRRPWREPRLNPLSSEGVLRPSRSLPPQGLANGHGVGGGAVDISEYAAGSVRAPLHCP